MLMVAACKDIARLGFNEQSSPKALMRVASTMFQRLCECSTAPCVGQLLVDIFKLVHWCPKFCFEWSPQQHGSGITSGTAALARASWSHGAMPSRLGLGLT